MEQAKLEMYIKALTEKGVKAPCPRCGNLHFDIVGETQFSLQSDPNVISIGGPAVPAVIAGCSRCGFLTFHASGLLSVTQGGNNV